ELDKRWPETDIEPSLDRIRALTDLLGDPQRAYPVVHVAGTNGKTSVVRMIDALLSETGLRTGRYTSPHLQRATERITLDGGPISPERYVEVYREIQPYIELVDARRTDGQPALSKFEVLTAMAFAAFADAPVDVAVIETGLGGSWDATNVADGAVSVITPIGVDHVEYLGPDLAGIAKEKAGIIKPGSIAVMAAQDTEVAAVLLERCVELGITVARQGMEFGVLRRDKAVGGQLLKLQGLGGAYDDVFLPLHGEHQAGNAAVALAAAEALLGVGANRQLDVDAVRSAFAGVSSPGRLERLRTAPAVLVDAAHNPHGARALAAALTDAFGFRRLVGVVAVLQEKDVTGMLEALEPVLDEIVVTSNASPRALDVDELAGVAVQVFGADRVTVEPRLDDAVEQAVRMAEEVDEETGSLAGGGVVVTGSVVTAGEARTLFGKATP
ncbi:MAG TPA: folylpolyglutamate synthase/dihydrofolate synthase family protein, partial [Pseudonocardia sp.]|uniref:bifunctional tetrahydrofolate synthase/dihydrofolate synthase n=1 Tax=Pseudonocardia sp. TaxID=60912 RepID=UPI002C6E54CF